MKVRTEKEHNIQTIKLTVKIYIYIYIKNNITNLIDVQYLETSLSSVNVSRVIPICEDTHFSSVTFL